jgi:N-acetylglucosaminyldiphosphoundecaprenol N-acetyl-beta-D-mannosaminyltransferase
MFGIDIHDVTMDDIYRWIVATVDAGDKGFIVTPNLDHIVKLQKDRTLRAAYDRASIVVSDSTPLGWAAKLIGEPFRARVGNLPVDIIRLAAREQYRVFLLGSDDATLAEAVAALRARLPGIRIVGTQNGYFEDDAPVVRAINESRPHILFVAMGCPKQERWINEHLDDLDINVAACVGGAFSYFAGKVARAPKIVQRVGMEWFWRFLHEPRRLFRRYFVDDVAFARMLIRELRTRRRS